MPKKTLTTLERIKEIGQRYYNEAQNGHAKNCVHGVVGRIIDIVKEKAPDIEGGWVIEGAWSPVCAPEYWRFSGLFSADHLQATRFARKVDAECMAANMLNGINVRVCFHEWG